jgi:hypothetical protein
MQSGKENHGMSNYSDNKAAIDAFRKQLKAEIDDISELDARILTMATADGLNDIKSNTPVDTGFLRKSWRKSPTVKSSKGVSTSITNNADYALYVNYGHRIVNKKGETVGFVKGLYMLEKAKSRIEKNIRRLFEEEVRKIKSKYDS